ncbi:hypothetical protein NDU88_003083 [Pleurodeles waltl]|uniref:Uncharacterized protein n=1 Tax=Pleurodeles waltl TaxID=8319 RepID=A0AAV7T412_PLEWA|nr:hypothetical protein NDU88_003083 [Pleurodeles waltl]
MPNPNCRAEPAVASRGQAFCEGRLKEAEGGQETRQRHPFQYIRTLKNKYKKGDNILCVGSARSVACRTRTVARSRRSRLVAGHSARDG